MSDEELKAAARRFFEEVWNKGNLDVADELFHPDHTSPSAVAVNSIFSIDVATL